MKQIPLSRGKVALVDDADFGWLSQYRWHASPNGSGRIFYAVTRKNGKTTYMHRLILRPSGDLVTDHINRNGLDNRRGNLRAVRQSLNMANYPRTRPRGLRGVWQNNRGGRWHARARRGSRRLRLGSFDTPEEAALAYDQLATQLFGDAATLNFPQAMAGGDE